VEDSLKALIGPTTNLSKLIDAGQVVSAAKLLTEAEALLKDAQAQFDRFEAELLNLPGTYEAMKSSLRGNEITLKAIHARLEEGAEETAAGGGVEALIQEAQRQKR
jgi:predicted  nucleic acid-binding Zn-ribbon protein